MEGVYGRELEGERTNFRVSSQMMPFRGDSTVYQESAMGRPEKRGGVLFMGG